MRRRLLARVRTLASSLVRGSARARAGTGDRPADVRPVLGWTDAADARNPLSWLQAPRHLRGRRGARRWVALPQTRNPAGGFTDLTRRPERDRDSSTSLPAKPPGSRSTA